MMHAVAVDDEPLALEILRDYCLRSAHNVELLTFTSTAKALHHCTTHRVDLLFLDIQMPSMSGLELYEKLPVKPTLIFTTAHAGFALNGFEVGAYDYLLKPISYDRFEEALRRVTERQPGLADTHPAELLLKANYGTLHLAIPSILFVESYGDHLHIHMADGKTHEVRMPLKNFLDLVPADTFARIHRSYAVAVNRVEFVRNKMVHIGGRTLPIGRKFSLPQ